MKKIEIGIEDLIAAPLILLIVVPLFIALFYVTGFVIRDLWLWFMVPLGLPVIGISHALGINLLVKSGWQFNETPKDNWKFFKDWAALAMVWFVGWVFHKIMIGEIHWP